MEKTPRKFAWKKRKQATIGIGTLIVFIALVLVAAIASAVILKTAYSLKDSAEKTGKAATTEVSGGLKVLDIVGDRQFGGGALQTTITGIRFTVTVWDGSSGINIEWLRIHWIGPQVSDYSTLNLAGPASASGTLFGADEIPSNIVTTDGWDIPSSRFFLLNENVLYIELDLRGAGLGDPLDPGDTVNVYFEPASGLVVSEGFTTPTNYGTNQFVDLTMQ